MTTRESPSFADLLRRSRHAAALTQEELAERAGLSRRGIADLERGARRAPRRVTLSLLADALGLLPEQRPTFFAAALRREAGVTEHPAPVGAFLGALPSSPLVGREGERSRLLSSLGRTMAGDGGLVLLQGEPGIGKTRLAQEVAVIAQDRGCLVATGRCYETQRSVPYAPFLEALTTLMAEAGLPKAEVARRWPLVLRLLARPAAPEARAPSADDRGEQQRLRWQVAEFLKVVARARPLALLLDDLHWADEASEALVEYLARQAPGQPILLLGTYRVAGGDFGRGDAAGFPDLDREHLVERVVVRRLTEEGTAALVRAALGNGAAEIAPELVAWLHRTASGVPFFALELLASFLERGKLRQEESGLTVAESGDIEVPQTIRSVITQRVALLGLEAREALEAASVLGQRFAVRDLRAMTPLAATALDRVLDDSELAGLIAGEGIENYSFAHGLIQEVLYSGLTAGRRRRLHAAAGAGLASQSTTERARRAAEIASHFIAAGETARAVPHAIVAGDRAAAISAHAEAGRHYRIAAELALREGDDAPAAEALEKLADELTVSGRYDEARSALERALALAAPRDAIQHGRMTRKLGDCLRDERRYAEAEEMLARAGTSLGRPTQSRRAAWWREWIDLQMDRFWCAFRQAKTAQMASIVEEALPAVERWASQLQRSRFDRMYTGYRMALERYITSDDTMAYIAAAAARVSESDPTGEVISARFDLAFAHLWHGDRTDAEAGLRAVCALARDSGYGYSEVLARTYLCVAARKANRVEEVEQLAHNGLALADARQMPVYAGAARAHAAWAAWRSGDLGRAAEEGLRALASWRDNFYPFQWLALWPLIGVASCQGEVERAVQYARRLLNPQQQRMPAVLEAALGGAIEAWEAGQAEAAGVRIGEALAKAADDGYA